MRSGVPWHIKGVHPDVRDNAREAARRAGMSVGQWLNAVILESAADEDDDYDDEYAPSASQRRARRDSAEHSDEQYRSPSQEPEPPGRDLAVIADHIQGLTEEVERLARVSAAAREAPPADDTVARKLADAIAKLDQRVETYIQEGRSATEVLGQKVESVDRALAALGRERFNATTSDWVETASSGDWAASVDQACDEIARRQRELEGEIFPAAPNLGGQTYPPRARDDFVAIYNRLKQVSDQVEAFGAVKMREAIDALRGDLAEIAIKLVEASPRRAIEALEGEVKTLASRVDEGLRTGGGPDLSSIESGLAEVRDAIRNLTPAESLAGAAEAIRVLSQKIDQMAAGPQDPRSFEKMEAAIAGLRGIVSNVATGDSLAALTAEVRTLSDRVTAGFADTGGAEVLRNLEQRISTIADAIETVRVSTANTSSSALETAVQSLAEKIDRLQAVPEPISAGPDIGAMIGSLGDKIDRLQSAPEQPNPAGPDLNAFMEALGARIDRIQPPAPAAPVDVDHIVAMIGTLSEKIEGLRVSRGDSDTLRQIEERIGLLSQKLEASEAKLGNLDNIERGMKELLAYLDTMRRNPPVPPAPAHPGERPAEHLAHNLAHDVMRTQESLEAAHGTIGDVVDRLAMIETGMRQSAEPAFPATPQTAPAPTVRPAAPQASAFKPAAPRTAPRVDDIPPSDLPLEPGSGKPRAGSLPPAGLHASVSDRIAASKAVVEPRAPGGEAEQKSSFILAARRAAQAAAADESTLTPRAPAEPGQAPAATKSSSFFGFGKHIKTLLVGASVAIIAAGAIHLAFSFLNTADRPADKDLNAASPALSSRSMTAGTAEVGDSGVLNVAPPSTAGANPNAGVLPLPQGATAPGSSISPPPAAAAPTQSSAAPLPAMASPPLDVTGALMNRPPAMGDTSALPGMGMESSGSPLPAAIGSKKLITAAEAGDPAAAYEIAIRYSDGRGIPLNPEEAAVWFQRAANGGIVPAIFRLGGLYEKGIGVKKDLSKARDLYVAAAERGNAKAMHNLAVLYADGFDGKPDYAAALQWFQKAGARGVPDSQYNLGVLYARGIGVEQNFGESYRWFALAAQSGDQDAAQKRDDVAKRLDAQTLSAMRSAVQKWAPEPQPDEAVTVKAPPGGWESGTQSSAPAAAPKGKAKRA